MRETEATRITVKKFLSDALGMDDDDADIDACKVEHLVSSEARGRLVGFLRFLFSQDPVATRFLDAFRSALAGADGECKKDVVNCLICDEICFLQPRLSELHGH